MGGTHLAESLESRRHFAASTQIDTIWQFDQADVDSAIGKHVTLFPASATFTAGGFVLMLGSVTKNAVVVVELDQVGKPVAGFGTNGIANPLLTDFGRLQLRQDDDGYIFVSDRTEITRLYSDGTRDVRFGDKGRVNFTAGTSTSSVLDVMPDHYGGVDLLRSQDDKNVQLVHISPKGKRKTVWDGGASFISNPVTQSYSGFTQGKLVAVKGGGWVVVSSREFYQNVPDPDSGIPEDIGGDA